MSKIVILKSPNCVITNDKKETIYTGGLLAAKVHLIEVFESYIDSAIDYNDDTDEYETILRQMNEVDFTDIDKVRIFLSSMQLMLV